MSKKSAAENRRSRQASSAARQRAQRARGVTRNTSPRKRTYWHAGWPGLEPGTILVGSDEATGLGIDSARYMGQDRDDELDPYDASKVYFSNDIEFARAFATNTQIADSPTGVVYQRGALYRVEPIGDIEPDPDFQKSDVSWCSPRARIVTVEDPNVMMDAYSAAERIGPHMAWTDGSPVYSKTGKYLLSPEQKQSAFTQTQLDSLVAWTPLRHVNAALAGERSGDRPLIEKHSEIAIDAAEATDVLKRHFKRAKALVDQGVEFSDNYRPVIDDLSSLIAPTELQADDPRAVAVAIHPRDGLIGAAVFTAARMGDAEDQMVMMIDRVAVTPSWRRKGVGSVLLTTMQQLLPNPVDFAVGHCDSQIAPFFAQMGYTVLTPDTPLAFPVEKFEKDLQPVQFPGQCAFYRQGRW
ncbi:Acetyltransferase (GNAT) family protein [Brevibacterium sandarakinum]|uniref:Acetyltransferase (GNAT) family protein n=2 Tax=Brevibacterium sandarakinum TaxID=629680 RepID=A0A1H1X2W1_BRESA|nr:Acetyltransferase (GNAT) family protein [Brevibacterium sandarakinum]